MGRRQPRVVTVTLRRVTGGQEDYRGKIKESQVFERAQFRGGREISSFGEKSIVFSR